MPPRYDDPGALAGAAEAGSGRNNVGQRPDPPPRARHASRDEGAVDTRENTGPPRPKGRAAPQLVESERRPSPSRTAPSENSCGDRQISNAPGYATAVAPRQASTPAAAI